MNQTNGFCVLAEEDLDMCSCYSCVASGGKYCQLVCQEEHIGRMYFWGRGAQIQGD